MGLIQFVSNYNDLSTENGFQFEFFCDRCGGGLQTQFESTSAGTLPNVLNVAGNLFGGVFSSAAELGEQARSAGWEKEHDAAFIKAVNAAKPHFNQCGNCGNWLDAVCWNGKLNLCKDCVPDVDDSSAIAEAEAEIEQAGETARTAPPAKKKKAGTKAKKALECSACGADASGAKFCPECGNPVQKKTTCSSCDTEINGAKFCPECGTKQ